MWGALKEIQVIWGDTGEIGGDIGGHGGGVCLRALGTLERLWGLRTGKAIGDTGEALGSLGGFGEIRAQPLPTSAFTLWISFSSSSGIIFPLRRRDRDGDTEGPPDLGPPRTSQHLPLICPHQVNVVCANSQESSSF